MLGIFMLSSQSRVPQAPGLSGQFTAVAGHFVAYAALAVLIAWGIGASFDRVSRRTVLAYFLTVLYGISDEIHQSFVPGRYATVEDVLIDAAGAAIGLAAMHVLARRSQERAAT